MVLLSGDYPTPRPTYTQFQYLVDELKPAGVKIRLTMCGSSSSPSTIDAWYPAVPDSMVKVYFDYSALTPEMANCLATTIREKLQQIASVARHRGLSLVTL